MTDLTVTERIKIIEMFFRDAFIVDGEVRVILNKEEINKFKVTAVVEMHDSERGVIYVAHVEKDAK